MQCLISTANFSLIAFVPFSQSKSFEFEKYFHVFMLLKSYKFTVRIL